MAYAGALFADSCLRGLNGDSNVFDYSYVESDVTDVPFFSSRVDLGPDGTCSLAHPVCVYDCIVVQFTVNFEPLLCSRIGLQPKNSSLESLACSLCQLKCAQVFFCVVQALHKQCDTNNLHVCEWLSSRGCVAWARPSLFRTLPDRMFIALCLGHFSQKANFAVAAGFLCIVIIPCTLF